MIIRGRFIGDAPYVVAHLRLPQFQGLVWLPADTGASRTTLLDRDMRVLDLPSDALIPALFPLVGIGGSVRSFLVHDVDRLPPEEVSRILRLPSVMGRDLINRFRLVCDYQAGTVELSR